MITCELITRVRASQIFQKTKNRASVPERVQMAVLTVCFGHFQTASVSGFLCEQPLTTENTAFPQNKVER